MPLRVHIQRGQRVVLAPVPTTVACHRANAENQVNHQSGAVGVFRWERRINTHDTPYSHLPCNVMELFARALPKECNL